jgi:GMP synthase-like glutamine amidotransferase
VRVHYFQHVPYETLGSIEGWAATSGHDLTCTRWFADEIPPGPEGVDLLIVLGGPMSVHDEAEQRWLVAEKRFIDRAIAARVRILGICLGAQLLADRLGASVTRMAHKEIGWFPIRRAAGASPFAGLIPDGACVFHWHGEAFDAPHGSSPIAASEACANQGFSIGDRILALQFHLEMTRDGAAAIIDHCGGELRARPTVQSAGTILAEPGRFETTHPIMAALLDRLAAIA